MKLPSVGAAGADPFLFALCTGIGILLVSLPVTAYLVLIGQFAFIAWPALSATLIFMIGYFALNAVALLGVAIAPGCWSGVGMMCAFVLGSAAFREPIARVDAAAAAVALLVVGIACVSSSKTPPPAESQASSPESVDAADEAPFIRAKLYRGLAFCLATGLADGCLMVPFKLARAETLIDSFNYLACFGFWGGLLSPAYYALYLYATGAPRPTVAAIRVAAFPGLSSGVLWAVAFFGSTMGRLALRLFDHKPCIRFNVKLLTFVY